MSDNITITDNSTAGFPIHRTVTVSKTRTVKRGRGRPPKNSNEEPNHLLFKDELSAAFREAKAEYEKTMPYKLTNGQFMMTLLHNFKQRQ